MSVKSKLTILADAIRNAIGITSAITIDHMITIMSPNTADVTIGTAGLVNRTLKSYNIPSGVTSIGTYAFADCSSLTSVTIPSGVTSIGAGAFSGCSSLTSVTIPSSVTSIGPGAFSGCNKLTHIYCGFAEGAVSGAPWGATNATIHYNS